MINQNCHPTNYQKDRLISNTKKYKKQKLDELKKNLNFQIFFYDFIKYYQKDQEHSSYKLKDQKLRKKVS